MIDFLRAGGFSTVIVLVVGAAMLVAAVRFARAADPGRLALVRALTWAIAFAAIAGIAANVREVCNTVAGDDELLRHALPVLLAGLGEALTPAILAGAIASISWILVGVGVRRMPA